VMKRRRKFGVPGIKVIVLSLAFAGGCAAQVADATPSGVKNNADAQAVFAKVADTVITHDEYNAAFSAIARSKFFHGKAADGEVAALQREVADQLVMRVLLLREARERGLQPDGAEIQKTLQSYEDRYANSAQWKKTREQVLPGLTARFEELNLLAQLEKEVRAIATPNESEVRAYYAAHPEKFTEPEQLRISVILLKVDPSSPTTEWDKMEEDAKNLVQRLQQGADFAEIARERSGEKESAKRGGDMDYVHAGMLPDVAQEALSKIQPGELTAPIRVLQGVAVFRLTDRKVPRLSAFDIAKRRAEELLKKEQSDLAWSAFNANLKNKTPTHIDQSRFLPLSEKSDTGAAPK
jgi:parvulin-like peptidyl-prolyl isomerase